MIGVTVHWGRIFKVGDIVRVVGRPPMRLVEFVNIYTPLLCELEVDGAVRREWFAFGDLELVSRGAA